MSTLPAATLGDAPRVWAPALRVVSGGPARLGAADPEVMTVTSPLLPTAEELLPYLEDILQSRWVTNDGKYLQRLERELTDYLDTPELATVTNATVGLDLAVKALAPEGEVITTGFSFPATYHVLLNNPGTTPVFADIDDDFCLDPAAVEAAVTPRTRAILAVHTYGYPCDVAALEALAARHGIPLLFDAAHAFGVRLGRRGIGRFGDLSVFSFHATKVFTTLEGGCVTSGRPGSEWMQRLRLFRNFGIRSEEEVVLYGLNGKVDEVRAAVGLLNLCRVDAAIARRRHVVDRYLEHFASYDAAEIGIRWDMYRRDDLTLNYAYFPVLVHRDGRRDRDRIYDALRAENILVRKYFHPTVVTTPLYRGLFDPDRLTRTEYASRNVLCLPVHHLMTDADCDRVIRAFDAAFFAR